MGYSDKRASQFGLPPLRIGGGARWRGGVRQGAQGYAATNRSLLLTMKSGLLCAGCINAR